MNTVVNCKDLKIIHKVSEQHTWKHNVKELQKIITLGTEHVIRKVLIWKNILFNMGNNIKYTINFISSICNTAYPRNMDCFGYKKLR